MGRRTWLWIGLAALVVVVGLGIPIVRGTLSALGMKEPVIDTVPPELPPELGSGSLAILSFSKTSGFRHEDAIPAAAASLDAIAARRGWTVFATENAAVFDDELLARFALVFANNTTGDNWTEAQKAAFVRFVEAGGGVVGVHGAAGTRYRYWDWYTDVLLLARFIGHPVWPQFQEAAVLVEDGSHPATRHLPARWMRTDEWYSFERSARELGAHVLATLDESTYEPKAFGDDLSMGDHPIVWVHCPGEGRAFYSAIGHSAEAYQDADHEAMLEGALSWAAGLEGTCP